MQYKSTENKLANVVRTTINDQHCQTIPKILRKFSIIKALYFFGLKKFLIYWDLENFHALQNLENKWKL